MDAKLRWLDPTYCCARISLIVLYDERMLVALHITGNAGGRFPMTKLNRHS